MRKNFGSKKVLRVGDQDESLLKFPVEAIPAGVGIRSATLRLYVSDSDCSRSIDLYRAKAVWSESAVTFASFGNRYDPQIQGSLLVHRDNVQKSVDLTELTRGWLRGDFRNDGVVLASRAHDTTTIVSREGGVAAQRPTLRVCYSVPVDHCAANPCEHGGSCESEPNGYTCHCTAEFAGPTCATSVDDCTGAPCQHGGACSDGNGTFTCSCPDGYVGSTCETDIDDCASNVCHNGGVCEDAVAGFACHCLAGYTGVRCEEAVDSCSAQPCVNGGVCSNLDGSFTCSCPVGFEGPTCEVDIDDCASQPCHSGGTCVDGAHTYHCVCPPDWGGSTCDTNLNSCAQSPCLNGAACVNGYGTYACVCPPGYSGANCEADINDCIPNPCLNQGVCVDGVASFACACAAGYTGPACEAETCLGHIDQPPNVSIAVPPLVTMADTAVTFDGSSSTDPDAICDDHIVRYRWDLADDGRYEASGSTPIVSFTTAQLAAAGITFPQAAACGASGSTDATNKITLEVTDSFGSTTKATATFAIVDDSLLACPRASTATLVTSCASPRTVSFSSDQSAALSPLRSLVQYEWDFIWNAGQGFAADATLLAPTPIAFGNYPRVGTFSAGLRVTDDLGRTQLASVPVVVTAVNNSPVAVPGPFVDGSDYFYTVSPAGIVTFDAGGSGDPDACLGDGIVRYSWDLNHDGRFDSTIVDPQGIVTTHLGSTPQDVLTHSAVFQYRNQNWTANSRQRVALQVVDGLAPLTGGPRSSASITAELRVSPF